MDSREQRQMGEMAGAHVVSAGMSALPDSGFEIRIRPNQSWLRIDVRALWQFRDLLLLLVRRDFVARYQQTALGPAWAIVQPLIMTVVFTLVFGHFAGISTDGLPPTLFYLCGLLVLELPRAGLPTNRRHLRHQHAALQQGLFPAPHRPVLGRASRASFPSSFKSRSSPPSGATTNFSPARANISGPIRARFFCRCSCSRPPRSASAPDCSSPPGRRNTATCSTLSRSPFRSGFISRRSSIRSRKSRPVGIGPPRSIPSRR